MRSSTSFGFLVPLIIAGRMAYADEYTNAIPGIVATSIAAITQPAESDFKPDLYFEVYADRGRFAQYGYARIAESFVPLKADSISFAGHEFQVTPGAPCWSNDPLDTPQAENLRNEMNARLELGHGFYFSENDKFGFHTKIGNHDVAISEKCSSDRVNLKAVITF